MIYSIQGIVGFSTVPLALASVLGLVLCGISFLMVLYIIIKTLLFGDPVGGWPSLACMVMFMGGIQLFCIGILGQYLAKTYLETKRRPMDEAIEALKPDMILIHGDTSTTFAGALSAFYHQIPVGHVEAGLRTYDKYSPFPEEMNRKLVSAIADLYFCPTENNRQNLLKEGITKGVFVTGNTVIDALKTTVREDYHFATEELNRLPYGEKKIILVTCHRRENYGEPMKQIMLALRQIAVENEDVELVYPGDGFACRRIADAIEWHFGLRKDPPEFFGA